VEEALYWARRIGAERTIFTHMTHDLDYATLAAELPETVIPAYDGMVVDLCAHAADDRVYTKNV
jgi:phosphoribosyl 1,2-cyclic phosphate phosphodiesterase